MGGRDVPYIMMMTQGMSVSEPIVMLMKVMKTIPAFWPEGRDTESCSVLKSLIIKDGRMD